MRSRSRSPPRRRWRSPRARRRDGGRAVAAAAATPRSLTAAWRGAAHRCVAVVARSPPPRGRSPPRSRSPLRSRSPPPRDKSPPPRKTQFSEAPAGGAAVRAAAAAAAARRRGAGAGGERRVGRRRARRAAAVVADVAGGLGAIAARFSSGQSALAAIHQRDAAWEAAGADGADRRLEIGARVEQSFDASEAAVASMDEHLPAWNRGYSCSNGWAGASRRGSAGRATAASSR